jgi:hypothetical protein
LGLKLHLIAHKSLEREFLSWGLVQPTFHWVENLGEAEHRLETLRVRDSNLYFVNQMRNPRLSADLAQGLRSALLAEFGSMPDWETIVCGVGSGSSILALRSLWPEARLLAVQASLSARVPGWRHYPSQNFGDQDLLASVSTALIWREAPFQRGATHLELLLKSLESDSNEALKEDSPTLVVAHGSLPDSELTYPSQSTIQAL